MSQTQSIFDFNQFQALLDKALASIQAQPMECCAALSAVAVAGYSLNYLLTPSAYPNLDGPTRKSFISGHLNDILSPHNIAFHDALQDTYGSVSKVYGAFGKEDLYVSDPRFTHEVLVKELETVFRHPQYYYDINDASFGPGLLASAGHRHKAQRKMLNPVFTVKHMKSPIYTEHVIQIETFYLIAEDMRTAMIKDLGGAQSKELDMLRWSSATALELIGTAGIGHTFGTLQGVDSEYSRVIKNYFPALAQVSPLRAVFPFIYRAGPAWLQRKLAGCAPNANVRKIKNIVDVQDKQAQDILIRKKEALKDRQVSSNMHDMMSVLVKANMEANREDTLPEDQLLGQINTLIFGGHETTSGALSRTLQLLAFHPALQNRLRAELQEAPNVLSYDELNALPYLDALCREVLRLYPPIPFMERVALKDWIVPLRYPVKGKDGTMINDIKVHKGSKIYLGIREANRCKETWGEDADEFKPERWLRELPQSVLNAKASGVYSSMMTFSGGPRSCIGFKFSILELKVLLSVLIRSFKFAPGSTEITWLSCITMAPYPAGTGDFIDPYMPLAVTLL